MTGFISCVLSVVCGLKKNKKSMSVHKNDLCLNVKTVMVTMLELYKLVFTSTHRCYILSLKTSTAHSSLHGMSNAAFILG